MSSPFYNAVSRKKDENLVQHSEPAINTNQMGPETPRFIFLATIQFSLHVIALNDKKIRISIFMIQWPNH